MKSKKDGKEEQPNSRKKKENMLDQTVARGSKQDLILAIQQTDSSRLVRDTMKSPRRILKFIEKECGETIQSLAEKADITERELLLAIRDHSDVATRTKIADALSMTYYSVFGK